jgi:hypothetical protein
MRERRKGGIGDQLMTIIGGLLVVGTLASVFYVAYIGTASEAELRKDIVQRNMEQLRRDVVDELCRSERESEEVVTRQFEFDTKIKEVRVDGDGDLNATLKEELGYAAATPQVCEEVKICEEGEKLRVGCSGGGTIPGGQVSLEIAYHGSANRLAMKGNAE